MILSLTPKIFKDFLFTIVKWTANEVVYVSNFLAKQEPLKIKSNVIYNVLEKDFLNQCKGIKATQKESKIVLMICSLKANKGVSEFLHLAHLNRNYTFKLVVDASQKEIDTYFKLEFLPDNLVIYPNKRILILSIKKLVLYSTCLMLVHLQKLLALPF